jgi:rhamnose transport system substrate-binding protein
VLLVACATLAACSSSSSSGGGSGTSSSASSSSGASGGLKKGLTAYVIPKLLGAQYFTVADTAKFGGAIAALQELGENGSETSGTAATPASELPAIQAAVTKGADILIVSATDPTALCPTLRAAMDKGITVVTYDSDAPTCRDLFVNQASSAAVGFKLVDLMAKEINNSGDIGIVSAAASATNQNAWIGYMKQELAKYPNVHLVSIVYGNDDPTTATQVTQGLLQRYPNLKGIIAPTSVGIVSAAQVVSSSKYKGKVIVTGLGTPESMKTYVTNGVAPAFYLWNPADLGYLASYTAVNFASKKITNAQGQTFTAGKLGTFKVGPDSTIILGPPLLFNAANINDYHF